jgi:hypothetical protein
LLTALGVPVIRFERVRTGVRMDKERQTSHADAHAFRA